MQPIAPELEEFLAVLADEPAPVREMMRYALGLLLMQEEKAWVAESHIDGDTLHVILETLDGRRIDAIKPYLSTHSTRMLYEAIAKMGRPHKTEGES